jgi:transcriptional regulator with XRE-family HTH domain
MPKKPTIQLPPLDFGGEHLGQRLARLRKQQGLTQVALAARVGTLQGLVSAYERGRLRLSAEMAVRFALALEISLDELLGTQPAAPARSRRSRRVLRRLEIIERLPTRQQAALLTTIDNFLRGVRHAG